MGVFRNQGQTPREYSHVNPKLRRFPVLLQDCINGHAPMAPGVEAQRSSPDMGGDAMSKQPGDVPNSEPRVRFDETANLSKPSNATHKTCEDFMEQTISVPEIEMIFDIDFERVISHSRPSLLSQ